MRTLLIPRDAFFFCSCDFGSNAPGCIHWWFDVGDGRWHIGLEIKFQHESIEAVAKKWHALNKAEELSSKCPAFVLDPACWTNAGDSIALLFQRYKVPVVKGNNDRVNGWNRLRELLRVAPDGLPWLTIDAHRCPYLVRTLPLATSREGAPDDIDMADDHALDSARYGAFSGFVTRRGGKSRIKTVVPGSYADWKSRGQRVVNGVLARR